MLIDGKKIAEQLNERIAERAGALSARGHQPRLAAVLVGDDGGALSYSRSQAKHAEKLGIAYDLHTLPKDISMSAAIASMEALNNDDRISGIMLHLPLPATLDSFALQQVISPAKDVEGVNATNLGLLAMGRKAIVPCTAAAAFACIESLGEPLDGKHAVIVGRSTIVGKPLAMLLIAANATVTICHSKTRDLADQTRRADVLCVAAGKVGLIGAEHVTPGTIVIDVGTNAVPDPATGKNRIIGDVRFDEVSPIACAITPVPGGVGPVTVAQLMSNVVAAVKK